MRHLGFALSCLVVSLVIPSWGHAASVSQNPDITVASSSSPSGGSPYSQWSNGPSTNANFFPVGVWNQSPNHIAEFKGIGVNTFVGLWRDLDQTSLAAFARAGMRLIPTQNSAGLTSPQRTAIVGWGQLDEPDNAQPNGTGGYGPCLTPPQIVAAYNAIRAAQRRRCRLIDCGRGVSDINWRGRGSCTGEDAGSQP